MNLPEDKNNFVIEVTPEQLDAIADLYRYVDEEGYEILHYSPYWEKTEKDNG